jgi:hypothetical protein
MKKLGKSVVAVLVCFVVPIAALNAAGAKAGGAKAPLTKTPDQLKWAPIPDGNGAMTALAWGDPNGTHGAFNKFPAGFVAPLHTHSFDLRIVVLSGTMSMTGSDGKETLLPAGSFFLQPNTYKHVTQCKEGAECLAYIATNGKFDLKLVDQKK